MSIPGVKISRLRLEPYRNFSSFELAFGADAMLITGKNGRGKSNILEAISYLSIGKSIKGARDREAVPHEGGHFDIRADWNDGSRDRQLRIFYSGEEGKRVFVDGAPLSRVSDILSLFQTVHFAPQDVSLVLHFSAQRRRLLDILISQSDVSYVRDLQQFQRTLSQRNEYLRRHAGRRSGVEMDCEELEVWDGQLARFGGSIRHKRAGALTGMHEDFVSFYGRFAGAREQPGIVYRQLPIGGDDDLPDEEAWREEFAQELALNRHQDSRARHTTKGPHRDVFAFTLNGEPADTFGSQGQLKSLLLSWKMAELRFLQKRYGSRPVLLLDDVFSELDEERSECVMGMIGEFDQVVLTAPKLPPLAQHRLAEICLDG